MMKQFFLSFALVASVVLLATSADTCRAAVPTSDNLMEDVLPEDFQVFATPYFTISCPKEFQKSDMELGDEYLMLKTERLVFHEDGDEYTSSAQINVNYSTGGPTPNQIGEYAANFKASRKALEETCDDLIIDGNLVILRTYDGDDDYCTVNNFFTLIGKDGACIFGIISYDQADAHAYEDFVMPIIRSAKFK